MESGQTVLVICQLVFGFAATFFAIMLWSKTRDAAWMLVIIGVIFSYIEIVYSILGIFGLGGGEFFLIGSVSVFSFILPLLRMTFFIAAFILMIIKQSK